MNGWSLRRIERLNYGLGGVMVMLAAITQPQRISLGVAVGVGLACLNFFFLRKLIGKWTADAKAGRASSAPLLVLPKMIGLMAAVVLCMKLLPIDGVAFLLGFSVFVISVFVELVLAVVRPTPATSEENNHG
jgi:hypothetical protein